MYCSLPILSAFFCVSSLGRMMMTTFSRSTLVQGQFWVHDGSFVNTYQFTAPCHPFLFFFYSASFIPQKRQRYRKGRESFWENIFQELCSEFRNQVRNGVLICTRENDPVRGPDGKMHGNKCAMCASLLWVPTLICPTESLRHWSCLSLSFPRNV